MMQTFVYIYFMKNKPDLIGTIVPPHITYWKNKRPDRYLGGPFADKSGGLISFQAGGLEKAKAIIAQDPFILHKAIEKYWVKEWLPEN